MSELWATAGNEIAVARVGDLVLITYGKLWSDATWSDFVSYVNSPGLATATAILNYAPALGPNSKQRKEMAERAKSNLVTNAKRIGLLTDSMAIRGILTVFAWLVPGPATKAFSPQATSDCLDWLAGAAQFDRAKADAILPQLQQRVGL